MFDGIASIHVPVKCEIEALYERGHERQHPDRLKTPEKGSEPFFASERHAAMNWAQRLKRMFRVDIECRRLLHAGG